MAGVDMQQRRKEQRAEIRRQIESCPYDKLWYWLNMDAKLDEQEDPSKEKKVSMTKESGNAPHAT